MRYTLCWDETHSEHRPSGYQEARVVALEAQLQQLRGLVQPLVSKTAYLEGRLEVQSMVVNQLLGSTLEQVRKEAKDWWAWLDGGLPRGWMRACAAYAHALPIEAPNCCCTATIMTCLLPSASLPRCPSVPAAQHGQGHKLRERPLAEVAEGETLSKEPAGLLIARTARFRSTARMHRCCLLQALPTPAVAHHPLHIHCRPDWVRVTPAQLLASSCSADWPSRHCCGCCAG